MKQKYRKAVFIVLYRESKFFGKKKLEYLIFKRKKHWIGWEFCKGGVEKKENLTEIAIREIYEETGQKVTKIKDEKKTGKYLYEKLLKDRPGIKGQTYHLFSAELKSKKIKIDKREHSTYKWTNYTKAEKLLTYQNQKDCLKIVNESLSK